MERTIVLLLTCTAVEGYVGNHIFIDQELNWAQAQAYCRANYTDLSYIRSQSDVERLLSVSKGKDHRGWIGLQQDPNNKTAWIWSGGGRITFQNWAKSEPNNYNNHEDSVHVRNDGKWNDMNGSISIHFYCIQITVVDEEKTWEAALEHCRENHKDLSSMVSETERLLAKSEIEARLITDRVWIGLRYLGDRWLWVNGDPLEYEAWHKRAGQDHQCPMWNRCGALTKEGLWENRDCQEKLNFICY